MGEVKDHRLTTDNPRITAFTASGTFTEQEQAYCALTQEDKAYMRDAVMEWIRQREPTLRVSREIEVCKGRMVWRYEYAAYVICEFMNGRWMHCISVDMHNSSNHHFCLFFKHLFKQ